MYRKMIATIIAIAISLNYTAVYAAADVENFDSTIDIVRVNMPLFNGEEYSGFVEYAHTSNDGTDNHYAYVDCAVKLDSGTEYNLTDTYIAEDNSFYSANIMIGGETLCLIETLPMLGATAYTYDIMIDPTAASFDNDLEYYTALDYVSLEYNANNDLIMVISATDYDLAGIVLHNSVISYARSVPQYTTYMPLTTN